MPPRARPAAFTPRPGSPIQAPTTRTGTGPAGATCTASTMDRGRGRSARASSECSSPTCSWPSRAPTPRPLSSPATSFSMAMTAGWQRSTGSRWKRVRPCSGTAESRAGYPGTSSEFIPTPTPLGEARARLKRSWTPSARCCARLPIRPVWRSASMAGTPAPTAPGGPMPPPMRRPRRRCCSAASPAPRRARSPS